MCLTFRLAVSQISEDVALVLVATKDTNQPNTLSLAIQVIRDLPAWINCSIYFLGNPQRYSRRDLEEHGDALFRENERRVSLIAPVMRSLKKSGRAARIAILGCSPVFDLNDWHESTNDMVFFTDQPLRDGSPSSCRCVSDRSELLTVLHDPVKRIDISFSSFIPTDWDDADYTLSIKEGRLVLFSGTAGTNVAVRGIAWQDVPPTATFVRRSGVTSRVALLPAKPTSVGDQVIKLQTDECQVFRSATRKKDYVCPYCRQPHAWQTLRCDNDLTPQYRFGGRPIYRSLERAKCQGLFICTATRSSVSCVFVGQSVLDKEKRRVFIVLENRFVHAAEVARETVDWSTAARLTGNYFSLTDGSYALQYH